MAPITETAKSGIWSKGAPRSIIATTYYDRTGRLSVRRLFHGWRVLGALLLFSMASAGTVWFGFTAYFKPLVDEFGWSYTAISFVAGMRGVETGLGDIFAGFLIDRLGGRKVLLVGTLLMAAGFLLLSRVNSLFTFYAYFFIVCIGVTGSSLVVAMTILSRWFRRRLGTAFGILSAGGGLSGFLLSLIVYLLDSFGFRTAFLVFGFSILFIGLCATLVVRERPEPLGYGPDGDVVLPEKGALTQNHSGEVDHQGRRSDATGVKFRDVLRSRTFWTLVLVSITQVFVVQLVITHIMPYLESIGYPRSVAGQVAMAIPVFSVLGRLGLGWLGDRFNRRDMLIIVMSLQAAAVFVLAYVGLGTLIIPFLVLYGLGWGGMIPNRAAILRDYFGIRSFGSMLGVVMGLSMIGGLFGPVMAGRLYDATGSYYLALIIAAGLLVFGTLPLLSLRRPPVSAKV